MAPRASALAQGAHKPRIAPGWPPHVVIVGAGFAGLAAAKRLGRAPVEVRVIDRRNHHLFQPLLYQVATAALSPADIAARQLIPPAAAVVQLSRRSAGNDGWGPARVDPALPRPSGQLQRQERGDPGPACRT